MVVAKRDESAYWLDQLTVVSGPESAIQAAAGFEPFAWRPSAEERDAPDHLRWRRPSR